MSSRRTEKKITQTICLIGAGNVGYHLANTFHESGIIINQIFSRKKTKAKRLAKKVGAEGINDLAQIHAGSDIYIIAVKDDAIAEVAENLTKVINKKTKLVVHTSGATPSTLLKKYFKQYGVFYPLQSFSQSLQVDFRQIPICIDSNRKANRLVLTKLGQQISDSVQRIDDQERAILHVAGVLVNNFSNHLYAQAAQICESENINFDLLKPLIKETVKKIENDPPSKMQTGPAIRNDLSTIDRHLAYLEKFPDIRHSYRLLSQLISKKN